MSARDRSWASNLQVRYAIGTIAVVTLLGGVWAWTLFGPVTGAVVSQQRVHLRTIAQAGALVLASSDEPVGQVARRLVARTDLRMTVIAGDGAVLADTVEDPSRMENHRSRPEVAAALSGRIGYDSRVSDTLGVRQMYVAVPATLGDRRVVLRVSESQDRIDAIAADTRRTGLVLLAVALAGGLFAAWRISATVSRPVTRLAQAAERMADGDLSAPVPVVTGDLRLLADALAMLRDQIRTKIAELEAGQTMLRSTIDGLPEAVLMLEGERIALANSAAAGLMSGASGAPEGRTVTEAGMAASIASAVASGISGSRVTASETGPDPLARYHRVTTLPLDGAGPRPRTLVIVEDITEVRRLDAVRRDFVANASHELKTPASAIHLLAESVASATADGDAEHAAAFVGQLSEETDRLRRLVGDLLDLSRLETAPAPGSVTDVRAAARLTLAAHARSAAAAGLELGLDDSAVAGEDLFAQADVTDLAVALDNLVANAVAYTESGSVTVRLGTDGADVLVAVADTGVGIPPEHLDRVFERFYRVDRARSRNTGGTGLGLSLVRNAAERSGGSVGIVSEPGSGTTVTLRLPRAT